MFTVSVSQEKNWFLDLARSGSAIGGFKEKYQHFLGLIPLEALQALNGLIRERDDRMPISCAHTLMERAYVRALEEEGSETYASNSGYKTVGSYEEAVEVLKRAGDMLDGIINSQRGLIDCIHILEEVWTYAFFGKVIQLELSASRWFLVDFLRSYLMTL